jgi:hypothetical protein
VLTKIAKICHRTNLCWDGPGELIVICIERVQAGHLADTRRQRSREGIVGDVDAFKRIRQVEDFLRETSGDAALS